MIANVSLAPLSLTSAASPARIVAQLATTASRPVECAAGQLVLARLVGSAVRKMAALPTTVSAAMMASIVMLAMLAQRADAVVGLVVQLARPPPRRGRHQRPLLR
jgi:hypothetical protein